MILIDANALVILIVGLIDTRLFKNHKRTSLYVEQDYYDLVSVIKSLDNLVVLPNVWTEVDDLLNDFGGNYKYPYVEKISETIKATTEKYLESVRATQHDCFMQIGLTDSLLLEYAKNCKLLVTADSELSDYALAYSIPTYDMVKVRNNRI